MHENNEGAQGVSKEGANGSGTPVDNEKLKKWTLFLWNQMIRKMICHCENDLSKS